MHMRAHTHTHTCSLSLCIPRLSLRYHSNFSHLSLSHLLSSFLLCSPFSLFLQFLSLSLYFSFSPFPFAHSPFYSLSPPSFPISLLAITVHSLFFLQTACLFLSLPHPLLPLTFFLILLPFSLSASLADSFFTLLLSKMCLITGQTSNCQNFFETVCPKINLFNGIMLIFQYWENLITLNSCNKFY